jgi:hypothetical protein
VGLDVVRIGELVQDDRLLALRCQLGHDLIGLQDSALTAAAAAAAAVLNNSNLCLDSP